MVLSFCAFSNYNTALPLISPAQAEDVVPSAEIGHIDFLDGDSIVINDSSFRLTANTRYYQKNGATIPRRAIKENTFVLYQLGENNEIVSLTQSAPPSMPNVGVQEASPAPSSSEQKKIILENGVWHN